MPSSMLHLFVAKKVDPNASIGFYVGNLAPDCSIDIKLKDKSHLYDAPDWEASLKGFCLEGKY